MGELREDAWWSNGESGDIGDVSGVPLIEPRMVGGG